VNGFGSAADPTLLDVKPYLIHNLFMCHSDIPVWRPIVRIDCPSCHKSIRTRWDWSNYLPILAVLTFYGYLEFFTIFFEDTGDRLFQKLRFGRRKCPECNAKFDYYDLGFYFSGFSYIK
jgi:hypothetical protein